MKSFAIIENRSELGAGTRGASLGIDALKVASWKKGSNFFRKNPSIYIEHKNTMISAVVDTPNAKRINGMLKVYERQCKAVHKVLSEQKYFPLALSADHSCAGGTLAGIKKAYPDKRIGVIWIDAHGDMHSPYTSPSGNMHGMPLAASMGLDNLENRVNIPKQKAILSWNKVKNVGGISPKLKPEDLVFFSVRDLEKEEIALIEQYNIKNYTVDELRTRGLVKCTEEALDRLAMCDYIYLSFDVDAMDPELSSYGTGTPVEHGLSPKEVSLIINRVALEQKLCCFEIVEINPALDNKNEMAEIAFDIIESACNIISNRFIIKPKIRKKKA